MGLDVAKVVYDFLDRPHGAAYDFARHLAVECQASGEGNAYGAFLRSQIHSIAANYIVNNEQMTDDWESQKEILDWVESLPYDNNGYLNIHFNW